MLNNRAVREHMSKRFTDSFMSMESDDLEILMDMTDRADRVFVAGAGRTLLGLKGIAMALMQIGFTAYAVGEVSTPSIGEGDLLIAASNKGSTVTTCCFMKQAKEHGAKVALITSAPDSEAGQIADHIIYVRPSSIEEKKGYLTDSSFEYLLMPIGDCIVEDLAKRHGQTAADVKRRHANME